jgi:dephospho-CoA kinase
LFKVGVTGGIGAGKSLICSILERMGFPVFYSDIEAKKIITSNPQVRIDLIELFGIQIFKDHQLDRKLLANLLFSDSTLIEKMNAIVHPKVREEFENWALSQDSQLVFNEAAILFETGSYKNFDATILVTAPLEIRLNRVINRDNSIRADVQKRIDNQWSDEQKVMLSTYLIQNDDIHSVLDQIDEVLNELIRK